MKNILSIDVEDWFHILELQSTPDMQAWADLPSRVSQSLHVLMDEFDQAAVKATFFFLGWVAERFPQLVREAHQRGHEIASHGYAHRLIYTQTHRQFAEDIRKTKAILESITGAPCVGYRAPGFSLTSSTLWVFDELSAQGHSYDSSVFPAPRGHGGISNAEIFPYLVETTHSPIIEFPATVVRVFGRRVCFFGGGYLRLFPYFIIKHMARIVNNQGRPVVFYAHPREFDTEHPRLPMSLKRQFKSYVNLKSTLPKLRKLLRECEVLPFRDWILENQVPSIKPGFQYLELRSFSQ